MCRPPRLHNEIDLNWAGIYSHMHGLACEVSTVLVGIFCRRGGVIIRVNCGWVWGLPYNNRAVDDD